MERRQLKFERRSSDTSRNPSHLLSSKKHKISIYKLSIFITFNDLIRWGCGANSAILFERCDSMQVLLPGPIWLSTPMSSSRLQPSQLLQGSSHIASRYHEIESKDIVLEVVRNVRGSYLDGPRTYLLTIHVIDICELLTSRLTRIRLSGVHQL